MTSRGRAFFRVLTGGCLVVLLAALYFSYSFFIYRVAISNTSPVILTNVQIIMPGGILWRGTLKPGESHITYGTVGGEGDLVIAFDAKGRSYREGVDYVTSGAWNEYLTVTSDLKIIRHSDDQYRLL